ncbi:DNA damage-binding protein 1a [Allomyces javanicus]|nr:DNA damage-binding protein 1a [Allomyces javanicus]
MSINPYFVTAHPPSAVSHAQKGSFTGPNDVNLVVCKTTRLEIYLLGETGTELVHAENLFARVQVLHLVRPADRPTDLLFLCTDRFQYALLSWDPSRNVFKTEQAGSLEEKAGRKLDENPLSFVDPHARLLGLNLYQGSLKVVPLDKSGSIRMSATATAAIAVQNKGKKRAVMVSDDLPSPFTIRMRENTVHSMVALDSPLPTVAVLYQDAKENRHVRVYGIIIKDKELTDPVLEVDVPNTAHLLIPIPAPIGGFVVLDYRTATYFSADGSVRPAPLHLRQEFKIKCWSYVDPDGTRILVGNVVGSYAVLFLHTQQNQVTSMSIYSLGSTTPCTSLVYLDNGYAYLGSHVGDSALIKLTEEPDATGNSLVVERTYTNLGPITDFAVLDAPGQPGAGQLVTCSGAFSDGSLRVVRHGIEINEQVLIQVPGLVRVFACARGDGGAHDLLALSTGAATIVLTCTDGEIEHVETTPLRTHEPTVLLAAVAGTHRIVQVTPTGVYLFDAASMTQVDEWTDTRGTAIVAAELSGTALVVAYKASIVELTVAAKLQNPRPRQLGDDISALDVHGTLVAVALWNRDVVLLARPSFAEVARVTLDQFEARSIRIAEWDTGAYVLCGHGDGSLVAFEMQPDGSMVNPRKIVLGTEPVRLARFVREGQELVFGSCDRPVVLYPSKSGKLTYSNVNLKSTADVCTLLNPNFGGEVLMVAKEGGLLVGAIEPIENIHIATYPLGGEMARRIAHHAPSSTLAVLTERLEDAMTHEEAGFLKLFDDATLEVVSTERLAPTETPLSICILSTADGAEQLVVVGTAFVKPTEEEPSVGRVLVYRITPERVLHLAIATTVKGAVYSLAAMPGGRLAAGIANRVQVFGLPASLTAGAKLDPICYHAGFITALYIESRGDFLAVGDLMKSVTLLVYSEAARTLEVLAKDPAPSWVTAIAAVDDDHLLAADANCNVYLARRNAGDDADDAAARKRLELCAEWHGGEFINRFRRGCLHPVADDGAVTPVLITASANGALGIIAHVVDSGTFELLLELQRLVASQLVPVGRFAYDEYRAFANERKVVPMHGAVDGDMVERYLELDPAVQANMAAALGKTLGREDVSAGELTKLVLDLARLH